ncbi:MAG: DUF2934 domain-containing protein [Gemmatimonadaceae bacterium]
MSSPRRKRSDRSAFGDGEAPLADTAPIAGGEGSTDEEQIRTRAYELYLERGGATSDEMEDWLRAEREYQSGAQPRGESETSEHSPPA